MALIIVSELMFKKFVEQKNLLFRPGSTFKFSTSFSDDANRYKMNILA